MPGAEQDVSIFDACRPRAKATPCPDDPNQWQAATSIECIRQQPVVPGLEALDLSCARYDMAANVTNMFTDTRGSGRGKVVACS